MIFRIKLIKRRGLAPFKRASDHHDRLEVAVDDLCRGGAGGLTRPAISLIGSATTASVEGDWGGLLAGVSSFCRVKVLALVGGVTFSLLSVELVVTLVWVSCWVRPRAS